MNRLTVQPQRRQLLKQSPVFAGFTLIEILVALFILAIMGTMATVALRRIILAKTIETTHVQAMEALELAVARLRLDISQMIDRPIRDVSGEPLASVSGTATGLSFTRTGNINPLGQQRISHLQRIHYEGGAELTRTTWDALDPVKNTKENEAVLLKTVSGWHITYYDTTLKASSTWPVKRDQPANMKDEPDPLPTAIAIEFKDPLLGQVAVYIPVFANNLHPKKNETDSDDQTPT